MRVAYNPFARILQWVASSVLDIGFPSAPPSEIVYVDIDFPIIIRTTGVGIPRLEILNGNLSMPQWGVGDFNISESQEFIHSWQEGSQVSWHIHLTTNGEEASPKYVRFSLEYGYTDGDGLWVFPATFTTIDIEIPANTPSKTQMIIPITNFTPTTTKIGGHVLSRLERVASIGAAPVADPWVPMLQAHVRCDSIGSRQISDK